MNNNGLPPDDLWLRDNIAELERQLRRRFVLHPALRYRILDEARDHLLEAARSGEQEGLSPREARQRALERFGPPALVAEGFITERMALVYKVLFVLAVVAGLFLAWMDTRPHFDDTGILVMGLLICTGLLGLLGPKRPWLWALCVGIWIPIFEFAVFGKPSFGSLVALVFAFAGAYAGWVGNKILRLAIA